MTTPTPKKETILNSVFGIFTKLYFISLVLLMLAADGSITINQETLATALVWMIHIGTGFFVLSSLILLISWFSDKATLVRLFPDGYGLFWLTGVLILANTAAGYALNGIAIGVSITIITYLRFWRSK